MNYLNYLWRLIVDLDIASEETLQVVTSINGYNKDSLYDVIYAQTGYRNLEQLSDALEIEYEDWMQELDDEK